MMFRWFDFNQRLNDQGLIDIKLQHIFYTSIFKHKLKPHILRHDIKANSKQHLYFDRKKTLFQKISFKKWGRKRLCLRAEGPPPFIERDFLEKFFFL